MLGRKIPRGKLYHSLADSSRYMMQSLFRPMNRVEPVLRFEQEFARYCEQEHATAFPFARTGVYALLSLGAYPEGSEVLMPAVTIKGMVDVVIALKLVPVFVETDPDTFCFCMDDLQFKITSRTVAALVTPLFGLVPNVEAMTTILKEKELFVIVDFSQCLNGRYKAKLVCSYGDAAVYSSSSIKTLDTLGGGIVVTNSSVVNDKLKRFQTNLIEPGRVRLIGKAWTNLMRNLATQSFVFSCLTFYFIRILGLLKKDSALRMTGIRSREALEELPEVWFEKYTSIQAEIGLKEIFKVDAMDRKRVRLAEKIKSTLSNVRFPLTTSESNNVYWQLVVVVDDAIAMQGELALQGVDSATSSLELVATLEYASNGDEFPVATNLYNNGLILPCYPDMKEDEEKRLFAALRDCIVYKGDS
jgi:perosamine synthetase